MPTTLEQAKEIAAELVRAQFHTELSDVRLIEGRGEVNQVYEVTADQHRAVLRLNEPAELGRYQKEQWCSVAAHKCGVPTPEVICVGSNEACAYMLLEFVHGSNGDAIADSNDTWYALGKNLRLIHSTPVAGFGDNLEAITSGSSVDWQQYVDGNIKALTDNSFIESIDLTKEQAIALQDLLTNLLAKKFSFGLNHGDYSLANTILTDDGVPYAIDWGSAEAHIVPHYDLAVIIEESLDEDSEKYAALLSGYGMIRQDYEVIREEIKSLQLLDALDKVRWAIDRAPDRTGHHMERLKTFLKGL